MAFDSELRRRFWSLVCILAMVTITPAAIAQSAARTEVSSDTPGGPVLTKLFEPVYPTLALAAHVWGDVDLMLGVRRDGSVESVRVVSGHPLLRQAAQDSAQQSQFECRDCNDVAPYHLVYTFQLGETRYCTTAKVIPNTEAEEFHPKVSQAQNHVTVVDNPVGTCDMAAEIDRGVRSAKCLYLWRCSFR
jgi:hypothetical protein